MKAIELTQEQTYKLLEICKVLFPEYNIKFSTSKIVGDEKDFVVFTKAKPYSVEYIHWFEFLLCNIVPEFKKRGIDIRIWLLTLPKTHMQWGENINHPIDYVHQEFLKLPK